MKRDRIAIPWTEEDFALVGVPTQDGDEIKGFLERKEASGACRLDWTRHVVQHSDGRYYQDVAILRAHGGEDPQEIANMATAYLPDWNLVDERTARAIAQHR